MTAQELLDNEKNKENSPDKIWASVIVHPDGSNEYDWFCAVNEGVRQRHSCPDMDGCNKFIGFINLDTLHEFLATHWRLNLYRPLPLLEKIRLANSTVTILKVKAKNQRVDEYMLPVEVEPKVWAWPKECVSERNNS